MKWKLSDFKIRTKIRIGFFSIMILCILLGALSYLTIKDIVKHDIHLLANNNSLDKLMLEMRKNEKDFLLREAANPEFFKTGQSKYIEKFTLNHEEFTEIIDLIKEDKEVLNNPDNIKRLDEMKILIQEYHDGFLKVADKTKQRGFKDYGLVGELRDKVHDVESEIEKLPDNQDLMILMLQARRAEKDYFLRKDTKYIEKLSEIVSEFKTVISNSDYDEANKANVTMLMDGYNNKFNKVTEVDKEIGLKSTEGLVGEYRAAVHKIEPLNEEIHSDIIKLIDDNVKNKVTMIIITIVGAFFISILLAFIISVLITKPINKTNDMLKDIAEGEGDLTKKLEVNSKDELGVLAKWFNLFVKKIRDIVTGVKESADVLSDSSDELAAAIEQANTSVENVAHQINTISDGLQSNASIVEEATASIDEIASSTMIVSKESQNVANNSEDMLRATNYGAEKLKDVVKAIHKVKGSSNNMYTIIRELNSSSHQISEIISIITGISEQTNLLALNAAIEAARAGEHGKGFAVVADEVRKLAEESKESSEKIALLIGEIEKKTNSAHVTMKEEQELVDMSVEKANETNIEFDKILQLIEETVDKIKTISSSAIQQSEMVNQMTAAMNEISQSTQNSAASTQEISNEIQEQVSTFEEIGASIEELNRMAQNLKEQTDAFKVV